MMKSAMPIESSEPQEGEGLGAGADAMAEAMMRYMPLKSLPGFGAMSEQEMYGLMEMLRGLL